jgi:hypothetical protein
MPTSTAPRLPPPAKTNAVGSMDAAVMIHLRQTYRDTLSNVHPFGRAAAPVLTLFIPQIEAGNAVYRSAL